MEGLHCFRFHRLPTWICGLVCTVLAGGAGAGSLLEVAPLQAALGQWQLRAEGHLTPAIALGVNGGMRQYYGQRRDFQDQARELSGDLLWYPGHGFIDGIFTGIGLGLEYRETGHQRQRDFVSDVQYTEAERYDRWISQETYLTLSRFIGYRLDPGGLFTCSLRLVMTDFILTGSKEEEGRIYSRDLEMGSDAASSNRVAMTLYAGIKFD